MSENNSDEGSIFDQLDETSEQPSIGQDYQDWWVPDEMGAHLMGVIVEIHSAPEQFTDAGEVPDPIYTILSVGRGDFEEGTALCTKTHVQILSGLQSAELGDLVNLRHEGLQRTDSGNAANTYKVGVIKQSTWEESDQADEIQSLIDDFNGATGDNRMTEPYSAGGSSGGSSGVSSGGSNDRGEAADFLLDLIQMQNGEMPVDNAEDMLNDVRGFGVDLEETAKAAGLVVEDGVVRQTA